MADSIMERVCESRVREGLPGLAVQWGAVGDVGPVADLVDTDTQAEIGGTLRQRVWSCLQVLDGFLRQRNPVLSSMVVAERKVGGKASGSILDTVTTILGLQDLKTINSQSTLSELGMDSMIAVEIKQALEREFELFLTPQEVRGLTIARITEISEKREADDAPESVKRISGMSQNGMRFLMRTIGDELTAAHPILRLPSLASDGKTIEDATPAVFIVPGIEGVAKAVEPLAKNTKLQALSLQLGYDQVTNTIEEMAEQLLPHVRSRLANSNTFNIVGYSFGALVALELAHILEREGRKGKLCLIDGAPDFVQTILKLQMNTMDEQLLQIDLLYSIMDLIAPIDKAEFQAKLQTEKTWNEKLNIFMQSVPSTTTYSKSYQKSICNATFARVNAALNYRPADFKPLSSAVTLVRPTEISLPNMEEDYGLSLFTKEPVTVHYVEGNHTTILDNKQCAAIINKLDLEEDDPLAFKNSIMGDSSATNTIQTITSENYGNIK